MGGLAVNLAGLFAVPVAVVLSIPDRPQHPDAPPSGWCGETAIQEALLHRGVWMSQRAIHDAGKSKHPDLYSQDIPVALGALSVDYVRFAPTKGATFEAFVRDALLAGDPVLAGVKLLPTAHPEWGLDHFVLVVGHGPKGYLVDTTWNDQRWIGPATTKGISFTGAFYGLRIRGLPRPAHRRPALLTVLSESKKEVVLEARCPNPKSTVERRATALGSVLESRPPSPAHVLKLPAAATAHLSCAIPP